MFKCKDLEPDFEHQCENCGHSPIVPLTNMCGPCTWGEVETLDGEWGQVVAERCDNCGCEEIDDASESN